MRQSTERPGRNPGARAIPVTARTFNSEPRIAQLFLGMRQALGLSVGELAVRLQTTPAVVLALEAGRVDEMPGWPETAHVVTAYGAMLQLDVRPALTRLEALMASGGARSQPIGPAPRFLPGPVMTSNGSQSPAEKVEDESEAKTAPGSSAMARVQDLTQRVSAARGNLSVPRRRVAGRTAAVGLVVLAAVSLTTIAQSGRLYAGLDSLSPALAQSIRKQFERLGSRIGADGLRWIEVSDPRSRKADKLPVAPQR